MKSPNGVPHDPAALFRSEVPEAFRRGLVICLFDVYAGAWDKCHDLPWAEMHDLLPHWRRALLEAGLRDIAQRFDGVTGVVKRNTTKNYSHTCVYTGRVILTASAVPTPGSIVRRAEFRNTYARSNQRLLFDEMSPPSPADPLYALLLHGVSDDPRIPLFARIAFPEPDCGGYVRGASINLFQECKDEAATRRKAIEKKGPKPILEYGPEVA